MLRVVLAVALLAKLLLDMLRVVATGIGTSSNTRQIVVECGGRRNVVLVYRDDESGTMNIRVVEGAASISVSSGSQISSMIVRSGESLSLRIRDLHSISICGKTVITGHE